MQNLELWNGDGLMLLIFICHDFLKLFFLELIDSNKMGKLKFRQLVSSYFPAFLGENDDLRSSILEWEIGKKRGVAHFRSLYTAIQQDYTTGSNQKRRGTEIQRFQKLI